MKCISLLQPWASCVILGAKHYETRTWATGHRGELAIHACRRFPEANRLLCRRDPFRRIFQNAGIQSWLDLPTGAILGTVQLLQCLRVEEMPAIDRSQLALGDYRMGRWIWVLSHPQPLSLPVPFKGLPGIFEIPHGHPQPDQGPPPRPGRRPGAA